MEIAARDKTAEVNKTFEHFISYKHENDGLKRQLYNLQSDQFPADYTKKDSKGLTPLMEADMLINQSTKRQQRIKSLSPEQR